MAVLGYAGLTPFYGFAALAWLLDPGAQQLARQGFTLYALAILSFLAGSLWGSANVRVGGDKTSRLLISNVVTLMGVMVLIVVNPVLAAALLALLHLGLLYYEISHSSAGWYLQLRRRLTWLSMPAYVMFLASQLTH